MEAKAGDKIIPDLVLKGTNYEGLRRAATRIVGLKTFIERVALGAVEGAKLWADPGAHLVTDPKFAVRLKNYDKMGKVFAAVHHQLECVFHDFEEELHKWGEPNPAALVHELLTVKGFFHSVMWMFCLRDFIPKQMAEALKRTPARSTVVPGLLSEQRLVNYCGARILSLLIEASPRFRHQLWKCSAFRWALKTFMRDTAEMLDDSIDKNESGHLLQVVIGFLKVIQAHFGSDKLFGEVIAPNQFVLDLNICGPPTASEKERGPIDFTTFLRAASWIADIKGQGKGQGKDRPKMGFHVRTIDQWGANVFLFESFGIPSVIREAQRRAFASLETASDALNLFDEALNNRSTGTEVWDSGHFGLMTRIKAIAMTIMNPKVVKEIQRDGMKALKAFQAIEKEATATWKLEEFIFSSFNVLADFFLTDIYRWSLYLAVLILAVEASLPLVKHTEGSLTQSFVIEWFSSKENETRQRLSDLPLKDIWAFVDTHMIRQRTHHVPRSPPLCPADGEEGEGSLARGGKGETDGQTPLAPTLNHTGRSSQPVRGGNNNEALTLSDHQRVFDVINPATPFADGHFTLGEVSAFLQKPPAPPVASESSISLSVLLYNDNNGGDTPRSRCCWSLSSCDHCGNSCRERAVFCEGCQLVVYCSLQCKIEHWNGIPGPRHFLYVDRKKDLSPFHPPRLPYPCPSTHKLCCPLIQDRVVSILQSETFTIPNNQHGEAQEETNIPERTSSTGLFNSLPPCLPLPQTESRAPIPSSCTSSGGSLMDMWESTMRDLLGMKLAMEKALERERAWVKEQEKKAKEKPRSKKETEHNRKTQKRGKVTTRGS
uniref:MYND-type domain-containing protein n=1 Tax=Chromera velia CCMP2878 TaxID=1169474 RepID=A0A0G4FNV2_9ALVE|eukprot:Cvel_17939.t1-p1 / transcript=Cvel_17939.t1 / gene=Cvel_17939 / organism=Chromera_velia_CCMP2878 / gene_product=hypothetical protein / transcript_product=hypothetical protein / location=Cvel_scaffold1458:21214-23697(-) / protein_length=828 / sequence_SO=supercontig / SO=protein_coding / is_pseudo=false